MNELTAAKRLRQANDELRRACSSLEKPSLRAMAECSHALENAEGRLRSCLAEPPGASPVLAEAALELAGWIGRAQRLLDAAAEFHSGWMEQLGVMSGGYSSEGRPAAVDGRAAIAFEA